ASTRSLSTWGTTRAWAPRKASQDSMNSGGVDEAVTGLPPHAIGFLMRLARRPPRRLSLAYLANSQGPNSDHVYRSPCLDAEGNGVSRNARGAKTHFLPMSKNRQVVKKCVYTE